MSAPILPLLAIVAAGAYLLTRKKTAGGGGVVPSPQGGGVVPAGTGQNFRTLTLDEFEAQTPATATAVAGKDMLDAAPPPHGLKQGDGVVLILTSGTPDHWFPANASVTSADPQAATGYATAQVLDGPAAGLTFKLSTKDESDAYLWEEAGTWNWLSQHGFNPGPSPLPPAGVQA